MGGRGLDGVIFVEGRDEERRGRRSEDGPAAAAAEARGVRSEKEQEAWTCLEGCAEAARTPRRGPVEERGARETRNDENLGPKRTSKIRSMDVRWRENGEERSKLTTHAFDATYAEQNGAGEDERDFERTVDENAGRLRPPRKRSNGSRNTLPWTEAWMQDCEM